MNVGGRVECGRGYLGTVLLVQDELLFVQLDVQHTLIHPDGSRSIECGPAIYWRHQCHLVADVPAVVEAKP